MREPSRLALIAGFAAVYLIWGSTYLGIFFAIQSIPPFLMAGARFLSAGIIMYVSARISGAPPPTSVTWRSAFIIGGCLLLCGNGGVTISEKWVPTGLASVLVATVPIYMALLGWITGLAPRPTPLVWLGLIGGFVGVGLLLGPALTRRHYGYVASCAWDVDPTDWLAHLVGRVALFPAKRKVRRRSFSPLASK